MKPNDKPAAVPGGQGSVEPLRAQQEEESGLFGSLSRMIFGTQKRGDKLSPTEQIVNSVAKSVGRNIRNEVTKQIMRGILGALKK